MSVVATAQAHTQLSASVSGTRAAVQTAAVSERPLPGGCEAHRAEAAEGKTGRAARQAVARKGTAKIAVPVAAWLPGTTSCWRVAGEDGHVMSGKFGFTVILRAPAQWHQGQRSSDVPMLLRGRTSYPRYPVCGFARAQLCVSAAGRTRSVHRAFRPDLDAARPAVLGLMRGQCGWPRCCCWRNTC